MAERTTAAVEAWDFPRSTASVLLMVRFAAEHGVLQEDMLRGASLTPETAADPDAQIDAHQELAVVRNLLRQLDDDRGLGLRVGSRYQITTFGVFGFACLSSQTLGEVVSFALRYWDLSFAFGIPSVEIADDVTRIELNDSGIPHDVRRFVVERDLTAMFGVMNDLLPAAVNLRALSLRYPEPGYADDFAHYFGVRPEFSAPINVASFDAALLDQPLPQANAQTVAMCEAQCRELVARRRARTGIAHEVRERLVRLGGDDIGMETIASELAMSTRTLRRKLGEAGTSYRELLDEVREALAEKLLGTGALSVSDVAIRLGYAEASSFIFAFKRWKGVTPAAYQRSGAR